MPSEGQFENTPTTAGMHSDRVDRLTFVLTALSAFAVYWLTLAPNVTLEFSGVLATDAMYAGVPHPPGYPVWTIYSWLFTQLLPFSNIAWRIAVGSAVATALACGLTATMVSHCGRVVFVRSPCFTALKPKEQSLLRGVCGCVAGLVLAFSGAVWSKAVIVDVWALSLLMFTGVLWLLMRWVFRPEKARWLCAAFFLFGLLLTSNQELVVALPGLVLAVMLGNREVGRDVALLVTPLVAVATARNQFSLWTSYPDETNPSLCAAFDLVMLTGIGITIAVRRVATEWGTALLCGLLFLLGFGLCLFAPITSMSNPPVNWGYPRTVEGAFHLIGRGQYERVQPTSDWGALLLQLGMGARFVARDFGGHHLALSLLPFLCLRRLSVLGRCWTFGLLAVFVGVGPILLTELNPPSSPSGWPLPGPYFTAAYAILAVWLGLGLMLVGAQVARWDWGNRPD
jgi:hypothetical protein